MNLKVLKHTTIFKGRIVTAELDDVEYDSGRKSQREVIRHPGGATALGLFPNNEIFLIRQWRYPFGKEIWELPAGKLEPGEDPLLCARREFEEETGHKAASWTFLTSILTSPGFCDEKLFLYMATDISPLPGGRRLEEGELGMTLHRVPLAEAVAMIQRHEIEDAKSIISILLGAKLSGLA